MKTPLKGMQIKEILDICLLQQIPRSKICDRVPRRVNRNAVFVIDIKKVDHRDITVDDNGIYGYHSSPSEKVKVEFSGSTEIGNFRTIRGTNNSTHNGNAETFIVKRHYSWHTVSGIQRIVTKVKDGEDFMRYAVLQYIQSRKEKGGALPSHGNSKKAKEEHYRTKVSVIEKIKHLGERRSPKDVILQMQNDIGGVLSLETPSDLPRDRRQVYNALSKVPRKMKCQNTGPKKTPEFGRLVMMMEKSDFLRDVSLHTRDKSSGTKLTPNTFASNDTQLHWIRTFCNGHSPKSQLGIDMTYNVGPFYLTAMTFPHPLFVHKYTNKHPTVFLGMMTSTSKETRDYYYLASSLTKEKVTTLTYGTDGEYALEKAFESVFPIEAVPNAKSSIHLRCFEHVKVDMKMKIDLLKIPEPSQKDIIKKILGCEHHGVRVKGLVDCEDLEEYEERYKEIERQLPFRFAEWLKESKGRLRPLTETLKSCMLKSVRVRAGLGNPPNQYNNQRCESFNRVLKFDTKNYHVDQVIIHEVVEEKIVKQQEEELTKAIFGMGEYRLSKEFKSLQLDKAQWFQMSFAQKESYRNKVFMFNAKKRKMSPCPRYEDIDFCIPTISAQRLRGIWEKAAVLMETEKVIPLENGNFCVTDEDKVFHIEQMSQQRYNCSCKSFKEHGMLCEHIVVVCDNHNKLHSYLKNLKKQGNKPFQMLFKNIPESAGHKPGSKKRRGKNNVAKEPIIELIDELDISHQRPAKFTEHYHNDEPFQIGFIKDYKRAVACKGCENAFPRAFLTIPFDILVIHRERYQYPIKDEEGRVLRMELTKKKMGNQFYCVRKECILKRHPYFWKGRLQTADSVKEHLTQSHIQFLKKTMSGYEP